MLVLDTSAGVEFLLGREPVGPAVRTRLAVPGESIHVPHIFEIEMASALRQGERRGAWTTDEAQRAFTLLRDLRLTRYPHRVLLERIWQLRFNVTPYDAAFLALAEALDAPLVTSDARLARASGATARVELLP
jgi:predicted nucleic acid-binding protein